MRGTEFLSTKDVALLDFARIIGMMFPPLFTVPKNLWVQNEVSVFAGQA